MKDEIEKIIGDLLRAKQLTLATAESCTGGLIGHLLTNVPGSSDYFLGGTQVYSNAAKQKLLGVKKATLENYGAVSQETVLEMAEGVRKALHSDIGISVSGIAGPGGGTPEKPVGLVWIAIVAPRFKQAWKNNWQGTREQIKQQAAIEALRRLNEYLSGTYQIPGNTLAGKSISDPYDPVEVKVKIDENGEITPLEFVFKRTEYQVDSLGRKWELAGMSHFLVMVPIDKVYELIFDQEGMRWYIKDPSQPRTMA